MRTHLRSLMLIVLILIGGGLALSACGTVHGAGEDLEHSSNAVKKAM